MALPTHFVHVTQILSKHFQSPNRWMLKINLAMIGRAGCFNTYENNDLMHVHSIGKICKHEFGVTFGHFYLL